MSGLGNVCSKIRSNLMATTQLYVLIPLYLVFAVWCVFAPAGSGGAD
jgi:hypothetical protein